MPTQKFNPETQDPVLPEHQDKPIDHRKHVDEYSEVMRREKACSNPYSAFAPKPIHTKFESQDQGEQIVLLVRQHPIMNLRWMFFALVLGLAPLILRYIPVIDFFPERFQFMTMVAWYVLILGYVLENFLSWFFHVNIITDERVIDIDFMSLLYKRISSAKIDNIEDVTSSVGGFLGSFINYGNVEIQTSAELREFIFDNIPQPEKVTRLLNEMILEEEREKIEGRVR